LNGVSGPVTPQSDTSETQWYEGDNLSSSQYHVSETASELKISVRFLHPAMTAVMLCVLAVFWSTVLFTKGASAALLGLMCVTGFAAWIIGFGKTWVSLKPGQLITYTGPIAFDRRTRNPAEIEVLTCTLVRAAAGRGGTSERYAVTAQSRYGGQKPVTILYGFISEDDAHKVARLLTRKLNSLRPPGAIPVILKHS
jgi:hypothetical protein